jgi:regulator of cell morphogenesis and NO signaling
MGLEGKTMRTLSKKSNVADWATEDPAHIQVFEFLGIDYCCGGETPLEEACAERGLEVDNVLSRLRGREDRSGVEAVDWEKREIEDHIEHIETVHHAYLRKELPRISKMIEKVREVHGERHPELTDIREVYRTLRHELESHMVKEERVLFPLIRQLWYVYAEGQLQGIENPIRAMEYEHEEAGRALVRLRQLSDHYVPPDDACNTYRELMDSFQRLEQDLHQHIHEENNILFPRVMKTAFADQRAS